MIAIPNMSKPKSCYNHCLEDFIANEEIGCPLKDYAESHQYKNAIHPDCPLIEIDESDLTDELTELNDLNLENIAPTILEAEE